MLASGQKARREVFGRFRPPGALSGPWDRQKSAQDEKLVPGKLSGPPWGTTRDPVLKESRRRMSGTHPPPSCHFSPRQLPNVTSQKIVRQKRPKTLENVRKRSKTCEKVCNVEPSKMYPFFRFFFRPPPGDPEVPQPPRPRPRQRPWRTIFRDVLFFKKRR